MTEEKKPQRALSRRQYYEWLLIGFAVLVAYGLAISGFVRYYAAHVPHPSIVDFLYYATRLFVFEWDIPAGESIPWMLQIARWLAPASLAAAAIKAIFMAFWDEAQVLFSWRLCNHAIVCGLGRKGMTLIRDLEKNKIKVVGIEKDTEHPRIVELRLEGIPVLKGNAADPGYLRWAGISRAAYLFAVTGDDEVNLDIAAQASKVKRMGFPWRSRSRRCAIHVQDPHTADLFADVALLPEAGPDFEAHLFSIYQLASRCLLETHYPDPVELHRPDALPVRVTVFGQGRLVQEVVQQIARIGHYGSKKTTCVRVIATDADDDSLAWLKASRAVLKELIHLQIDEADLDQIILHDEALERLQPIGQVYVCLADTAQGLRLGAALRRIGRERVVVCLASKSALAERVTSLSQREQLGFDTFDVTRATCTFENLMCAGLDAQARKIHQVYFDAQTQAGVTPADNFTLTVWHHLPEALKQSNRSQADHLSVKLRALGDRGGDRPQAEDLRDQEELLAELEHRRWYAERRLAGWRFAAGPKDAMRRTSPAILPWEDLKDEEKEKDRVAIRNLVKVLDARTETECD